MDGKNMHFCFEAKDKQGKHVYVIYTAKLSERWTKSDSPLHFTKEVVITNGVPSMGCGVFNSKLVLAGGSVKSKQYEYNVKYRGVITCDLTTKQVSTSEIPPMPGGKVRPLVFQLDNKLFALDTSKNPDQNAGAFEVYYPERQRWHQLRIDYYHSVGHLADPQSKGLSFYSWFVFGHCVCLSLPKDSATFLYQAKNMYRYFQHIDTEPLPFPGMAITYCQTDFQENVVLITFSKGGLVEGRLLRFPFYKFYDKPAVQILDTKIYSQHDGDLTGCFTHFGNGTFCLTAFDNVDIYVHMFKISRRKCRKGEDLNIRLIDRSMHRYKYTDFSEAGHTSFSFAGCFSPSPPAGWSKENTEAKIYSSRFPLDEFNEETDDIPNTLCAYEMIEEFADDN
ncbi:hypothetical protein OROHE_023863 [Orobanche hederae]